MGIVHVLLQHMSLLANRNKRCNRKVVHISDFIIYKVPYMINIGGYTERDLFFLYTGLPPYHEKLVSTNNAFLVNIYFILFVFLAFLLIL